MPISVRFAIVGEANPRYNNMLKLCAWSIRHRAGALSDASIAVVYNEKLDEPTAKYLKNELDVQTLALPRISHEFKTLNKFNGLSAPGTTDADWVILIDADTAVINDLAFIEQRMESNEADFFCAPTNLKTVWGVDNIIRKQTGLTKEEFEKLRHPWFIPGALFFNSGVIIMRGSDAEAIRDENISLTPIMVKTMQNPENKNIWFTLRQKWNERVVKTRLRNQLIIPPFYPVFFSDQVTLEIVILKLRLNFELLPHAYNFRKVNLKQGEELPIHILHYIKYRYDFDRTEMFTGKWIDQYAQSDDPGAQALSQLVQEYNESQ